MGGWWSPRVIQSRIEKVIKIMMAEGEPNDLHTEKQSHRGSARKKITEYFNLIPKGQEMCPAMTEMTNPSEDPPIYIEDKVRDMLEEH